MLYAFFIFLGFSNLGSCDFADDNQTLWIGWDRTSDGKDTVEDSSITDNNNVVAMGQFYSAAGHIQSTSNDRISEGDGADVGNIDVNVTNCSTKIYFDSLFDVKPICEPILL